MKQRFKRFVNWFLSKKLKQKVRYLFIGLIALYLLLFMFIYFFYFRGNLLAYMVQEGYNSASLINSNLNGELQNINTMTRLIMRNQEVLKFLHASGTIRDAEDSIREITTQYPYISSVYVFDKGLEYARLVNTGTTLNEEALDEAWYEQIAAYSGGYILAVNGNGAFQVHSEKNVITLLRIINDNETQKPIGILAVNCSDTLLDKTMEEYTEGQKAFAYYADGDLVYATDQTVFQGNELYPQDEFLVKNNSKTIYFQYQVSDTPLIIAGSMPFKYGDDFMPGYAIMIILILIVITAASLIIIGIFISVSITGPIEKLVASMEGTKRGWLTRVSMELPDDEIGHLKDSYNNMLVEINRLIEELVEEEKFRQQAELLMLHEQIKPHFLYNTLDTIAYMALEHTSDETYDAIETLGNFYRGFLSKGSKEITVAEEVTIVRNYLKLQKLRYDDIFEDEYEIEEQARSMRIPKLILQPLVENSLYHGIRLKGEKGLIRIKIFIENKALCISVYDTGIGMSQERIISLATEDNGKSFGLKATLDRLRYYYNKQEVCKISSREGEFCEVLITVPLEDNEF